MSSDMATPPPALAVWRRPVDGSGAPVVDRLEDAGETLLVPVAEWASYVGALESGPEPLRVVLVGTGAPPDAGAYVDDTVPDDADSIAAAVRLSGSEIGRAVADASGAELSQAVEAHAVDELPPSLRLPSLVPGDLRRVVAAVQFEAQVRRALRPRPAGTAVAGPLVPAEVASSVAAAVVLAGLLRSGLRLGSAPLLRGEGDSPVELVVDQVAMALDRGGVIPAELGDAAVDIRLDGDKMVIRGEREVRLTVGLPEEAFEFDETGRRVEVPVAALNGRRVTLSIESR